MAPGVDVRANGGQIVGPGSIHPGGGLYEIQIGPDDCGIAVAPPGWSSWPPPRLRMDRPGRKTAATSLECPGLREARQVVVVPQVPAMARIAVDHRRDGIRCNAICPGWIMTEMSGERLFISLLG